MANDVKVKTGCLVKVFFLLPDEIIRREPLLGGCSGFIRKAHYLIGEIMGTGKATMVSHSPRVERSYHDAK